MTSSKRHHNGLRNLTLLECHFNLRSKSVTNEYKLNTVICFCVYILMTCLLWVIKIAWPSNTDYISNRKFDMKDIGLSNVILGV